MTDPKFIDTNPVPVDVINMPELVIDPDAVPDDDDTDQLVASADIQIGAMIGLLPSPQDQQRLAVNADGAEPEDELHLTLAYLGEAADYSGDIRTSVITTMESLAAEYSPVVANGFAIDVFNPGDASDQDMCIVLGLSDSDVLGPIKQHTMDKLAETDGVSEKIPEQHTPWIPHVTLIYTEDHSLVSALFDRVGEVTFDRLRVAFAGEHHDILLGNEVTSSGVHDQGVASMGEVELATESFQVTGSDTPDVPAVPEQTEASNIWSGVITIEDAESGDGRLFRGGSLTWADLPIPLMWQEKTGMGHDGAVLVGNITGIKRDGNLIRAIGNFDLAGDKEGYASEAYRLVKDKMLKGVSVDVDSVKGADIEYVFPEPDGDDEDMFFFPEPEQMIFNKGRIRGATLTPFPAFVEAEIQLGPEMFNVDQTNMDFVPEEHEVGMTASGAWKPEDLLRTLPHRLTLDHASKLFGYVRLDNLASKTVPKSDCYFMHHDVVGDKTPANLTACVSAIQDLNAGKLGRSLSASTRKSIYGHLAAHIREANMVPTPLVDVEPLVAAPHVITLADLPPKTWFEEPSDVEMHGALTVTDEGRVYGYLAPAGVNHRSFPGQNVQVPRGNVDYSLFMGGETIVLGGGRVTTGVITMDCGHATTEYNISAEVAKEHYDNSCSVVANIRIGENKNGVWVAGAAVPWLSPEQFVKMMSCRLSGDWRPHSQKQGAREFVGALLVPVPGFAKTREQASVKIEDGQLVAASIPVSLVRTKDQKPKKRIENTGIRKAAALIASDIGRDKKSRLAALKNDVHGGNNV